ncbi:hypothetical protein [Sphingomonas sp. TREG-RG-20F-R18-01]|uniref:hypothetical protein n=1 Tax=Sphingomonas sp. TREG-RG-20F-R18-01 TaxID=2914982 RepID=UPI001F564861|nr:hypothetical protein [Sphingomonas sp. TREG-RG-20F-R18-01]
MRAASLSSPTARADEPLDPLAATLVPFSDTLLDTVATNFCCAIGSLLERDDPAHGTVLIASAAEFGSAGIHLRCWDRKLCATDVVLDTNRRRDRQIVRTSKLLFDLLRARWPERARPARIGILSDGTGIAITPEDLWPMEPGWIDRRLADPRGLIALKRFSPDGGLALLRAPRRAPQRCH